LLPLIQTQKNILKLPFILKSNNKLGTQQTKNQLISLSKSRKTKVDSNEGEILNIAQTVGVRVFFKTYFVMFQFENPSIK